MRRGTHVICMHAWQGLCMKIGERGQRSLSLLVPTTYVRCTCMLTAHNEPFIHLIMNPSYISHWKLYTSHIPFYMCTYIHSCTYFHFSLNQRLIRLLYQMQILASLLRLQSCSDFTDRIFKLKYLRYLLRFKRASYVSWSKYKDLFEFFGLIAFSSTGQLINMACRWNTDHQSLRK